jgi:hypothetical protein
VRRVELDTGGRRNLHQERLRREKRHPHMPFIVLFPLPVRVSLPP